MRKKIDSIAGVSIYQDDDGRIYFTAGAMIDGDGSPNCYKPDNTGLDDLCEAKADDDAWCGIVTLDKEHRTPYVTPDGNYVSQTEYQWLGQPITSPARYVDSEKVPFIVVPPQIRQKPAGVVLGCKARVTYNGISVDAVVADIGPHSKIGELSIAAANALKIPSSPRNGGIDAKEIFYELWPGCSAQVNGVTYELQPMPAQNS